MSWHVNIGLRWSMTALSPVKIGSSQLVGTSSIRRRTRSLVCGSFGFVFIYLSFSLRHSALCSAARFDTIRATFENGAGVFPLSRFAVGLGRGRSVLPTRRAVTAFQSVRQTLGMIGRGKARPRCACSRMAAAQPPAPANRRVASQVSSYVSLVGGR